MRQEAFRFRLETVRSVRARKEELAQVELAGALSREREATELLGEAEAELERARDAHVVVSEPLSATELVARQAYLERAEADRRRALDERSRSRAEVGERRRVLTVAARDRQLLDRLKDRQMQEHANEQARRQAKAMDEIAQAMHMRRLQRGTGAA
jgi:flagellar FliJ protein